MKRFLILGGTGFIGPHTVRYAVERGHEVTIFTRGRADTDLPDVERLVGDRNGDLAALDPPHASARTSRTPRSRAAPPSFAPV